MKLRVVTILFVFLGVSEAFGGAGPFERYSRRFERATRMGRPRPAPSLSDPAQAVVPGSAQQALASPTHLVDTLLDPYDMDAADNGDGGTITASSDKDRDAMPLDPHSPVPEPAGFVALILGLFGCIRMRRR